MTTNEIIDINKTITKGIHKGLKTHNQLHIITPTNFKTMNIINNTVLIPTPLDF